MKKYADHHVVIVGAGFTGLAAAYELCKNGQRVTVLESEPEIGGLSRAFKTSGGQSLDRIYHHWFTSDQCALDLVHELGLSERLVFTPTNTGYYHNGSIYRLSTPLDLLRFSPIAFSDRIRLGLAVLYARMQKDWKQLEDRTAAQWLTDVCGRRVFNAVWRPLLNGKFGAYADDISAVWFWNKLKLRGGSRDNSGKESVSYLQGGYSLLLDTMRLRIEELGGKIRTSSPVTKIEPAKNRAWHIEYGAGEELTPSDVFVTLPPPLTANLLTTWASSEYLERLRSIEYLANTCLVLELNRSLSKTYWLNVGDVDFPFVGVIEHTNLDKPDNYGGRHIVYLSKYLSVTDTLYQMSKEELLEYSIPYIRNIFPDFSRDQIVACHLWREQWAQPIISRHYSRIIPDTAGSRHGLHMHSMAHIYPEDRGSNYAIKAGREMAKVIMQTGNL